MYANVEEEHNFLNITKDYTTKCHKRHEKLRNITMHQKKPQHAMTFGAEGIFAIMLSTFCIKQKTWNSNTLQKFKYMQM